MTPVSTNPTDQTTTSGTTPPAGGSASNDALGELGNEDTFLQLLVAQVQNQDPLNPTDSVQFVSQLVSFSQLEQLLNINQNVQVLASDATPPSSSSSPTTGNQN
jgi:flagellar basal-body rod modification protein FlgD